MNTSDHPKPLEHDPDAARDRRCVCGCVTDADAAEIDRLWDAARRRIIERGLRGPERGPF